MAKFESGIYTIRSPSGRYYIGSAQHIPRRWREHRSELLRGLHHCQALQAACNKYGYAALSFEVLERCEAAELIAREQHHMDAAPLRVLYNSSPTAGSALGSRHSEDARLRMSKAHKGKVHTPEHRANVAAAKRAQTPETLAKISAALKGRPSHPNSKAALLQANTGRALSDITRAKMSAARKGRTFSPEHRANIAASRKGKKHAEATLAKLRVPCSPEKARKISETKRLRHAARRSAMMPGNEPETGS